MTEFIGDINKDGIIDSRDLDLLLMGWANPYGVEILDNLLANWLIRYAESGGCVESGECEVSSESQETARITLQIIELS